MAKNANFTHNFIFCKTTTNKLEQFYTLFINTTDNFQYWNIYWGLPVSSLNDSDAFLISGFIRRPFSCILHLNILISRQQTNRQSFYMAEQWIWLGIQSKCTVQDILSIREIDFIPKNIYSVLLFMPTMRCESQAISSNASSIIIPVLLVITSSNFLHNNGRKIRSRRSFL